MGALDKESRARMLGLLSRVGDKACLSRFLHGVILSHYTGSENEDLSVSLKLVGPKATGQLLPAAAGQRKARTARTRAGRSPGAAPLEDRRRHRLQVRPLRRSAGLLQGPCRQGRAVPAPLGAARPSAPDHRVQPARHRPRDRAPWPSLHPRLHQEPGEPQAAARRVLQGHLVDAPADPVRTGQSAGRRMRAGSRAAAEGGGRIQTEVSHALREGSCGNAGSKSRGRSAGDRHQP